MARKNKSKIHVEKNCLAKCMHQSIKPCYKCYNITNYYPVRDIDIKVSKWLNLNHLYDLDFYMT